MTSEIKIYDVTIDEVRSATQSDVDRLGACVQIMARARSTSRFLDELVRDALTERISSAEFFRIVGDFENSHSPKERLRFTCRGDGE